MNTDKKMHDDNDKQGFIDKISTFFHKFKKGHKDNANVKNEFEDYYSTTNSIYYDSNASSNSNNSYYDSDVSSNSKNNYYGDSNDDYYSKIDNYNFNENKNEEKTPLNKKKLFIVFGLLAVLLIFIALMFRGCSGNSPKIKLSYESITLKVGESIYLSYEILNTNDLLPATFSSSNSSVATVDEAGKVVGIGGGVATISLSYKSGFFTRKENCEVIVISDGESGGNNTPNPTSSTAPELSLSLSNLKEGDWTNKDVTVNVSAVSKTSSDVALKYVINCNSGCKYSNVSGGTIKVTNDGTSVVTVVATDKKSGESTTKSINVKIDRASPKVTLSPDQSKITSAYGEVEVCAICMDNESGCVQSKTCRNFTASALNQTITVKDNAGNSATTKAFDVEVTAESSASCSLSISGDTIVATTNDAIRYSFDSNFATNTQTYTPDLSSSDISLNLNSSTTRQETITYYVMGSDGAVNTCSINVSITCTCKYMYGNVCYKNQERGRDDDVNSDACKGEKVDHSGHWCYKFLDPGYVCTVTSQ